MTCSNQNGWDRKYALKEADFHEKKLPDDIGVGWKDLARALGFSESSIDIIEKEKNNCDKECCIRVLVCWLHKKGEDATAEKIAEALVKIERKSLAERFPCKPSDPSQNPEAVIHDLEEKLAKMSARSKELEAEFDKMRVRNKTLEDEVDEMSARNKKLENEIQKNKVVLETVAVAVQEMEKYPEQRREQSLKRIKSQLKRVKLDVDNTDECLVSSVDGKNIAKDKEPKNDLLGHDATVPQKDKDHLLQSSEEQLLLCQRIFDALIKLIGEVSPQPKDNDFVWMSNLFFFTKELKNQEKLFSSKIRSLNSLKDNSNKDQTGELEKLVKRYKTHQQKVDELETFLSSLLFQRQGTKNQRSKPCSSKHSSQSQGLSDFQNIMIRPSISRPLCTHHMSIMDTDKEPVEGQSMQNYKTRSNSDATELKLKEQNDEATAAAYDRGRLYTHPIDKKKALWWQTMTKQT